MINLESKYLMIIKDILNRYIPERKVGIFGSRITSKTKPFSDVDLVIFGDTPLTWEQQSSLANAFSASDLPIRVDVVDWSTTSEEFRKIIQTNFEDLTS